MVIAIEAFALLIAARVVVDEMVVVMAVADIEIVSTHRFVIAAGIVMTAVVVGSIERVAEDICWNFNLGI